MLTNREIAFLNNSNAIENLPQQYSQNDLEGHVEAWLTFKRKAQSGENITLADIELAQKLITDEQAHYDKTTIPVEERGKIRSRNNPVNVMAGGYVKKHFVVVPKYMDLHLTDMNSVAEEETFAQIAQLHRDFEDIHPFTDGNGRTGRLVMNYLFAKHHLPIIVLRNADKRDYFQALTPQGNIIDFMEDQARKSVACLTCNNDYVERIGTHGSNDQYHCNTCESDFQIEF